MRQATVVFGLCLAWAPALRAQTTYVCPPAPAGVPGLSGGPAFAEATLPDALASQLDDPRWTGASREDFAASQGTQAAARILNDGNNLFLSLQAVVDPDGAQIGSDAVYLGFSKDGTTGVFVKLVMDAAPPSGGFVNDATAISSASSWKTTNGGASGWPKQGPQSWATPANIHLWTGAGTGNGVAWGYNAKMSLATLGTLLGLGGPLAPPFYLWYQINIETASTTVQYAWPAGSTVGFDSTSTGCTPASPCALLSIAQWGIVNDAATSGDCPVGISIDGTSIGTKPLVAGVPGTTIFFGSGQPGNDFVAAAGNSDTLNPLTPGSLQARFRIAGWPSTIGVGGSWTDVATSGTPAVPVFGTNATTGGEVSLSCVNPPFGSSTINCYQPPVGAPVSQGIIVELSQNNGSGYRFVHDSMWVDLGLVNPSTATGGAGGGGGSGGSAGGSAGNNGTAGAAGSSAGSNGTAGVAGSSAGNNGTAGAAGSSAGNNGSAGAGGKAGQGGASGSGGGQGGQLGGAGGGAGGKAGQGGKSGAGGAAGGQASAAGASGQSGGGGAAGTGGQIETGGASGAAGGPSGAAGAGGRSVGGAGGRSEGEGGGGGAGPSGSGGAAQTGGASGSTSGGGSGCGCGIGGSTPADSLLFLVAGLLMLLRRGARPDRHRARR
jgi:hypothetical protein